MAQSVNINVLFRSYLHIHKFSFDCLFVFSLRLQYLLSNIVAVSTHNQSSGVQQFYALIQMTATPPPYIGRL